jgi:hypothetical protein
MEFLTCSNPKCKKQSQYKISDVMKVESYLQYNGWDLIHTEEWGLLVFCDKDECFFKMSVAEADEYISNWLDPYQRPKLEDEPVYQHRETSIENIIRGETYDEDTGKNPWGLDYGGF